MTNETIEETAPHEDGEGAIVMGRTGITTKSPKKPRKVAPKPVESDKALLYSAGNITFPGVGEIKYGFTVVSKEAAAKWLTLKKVREATVDEVKEFYGV